MSRKFCLASVDVEENIQDLDKILDIFRGYGVSATLFVTGRILSGYPDSARDWARDFEIACHGFTHRFWNTLSLQEREIELDNFISLYKSIFNYSPKGFRAPSHIIDREGLALIGQKGFLYDSSIVPHYPPFKKYRGYQRSSPLLPYYLEGGRILEIPVRGQLFGIPLAGAWVRKLPMWFYKILFFIYRPPFITLSFHSWEKSKKFEEIVKLLKDKNYQFLNGGQIYKNYG